MGGLNGLVAAVFLGALFEAYDEEDSGEAEDKKKEQGALLRRLDKILPDGDLTWAIIEETITKDDEMKNNPRFSAERLREVFVRRDKHGSETAPPFGDPSNIQLPTVNR